MPTLAVEDLIADAVAAEVNLAGQAWSPLPNRAQRAYDNVFAAGDLASLRVVIIPLRLDYERQDRVGTGKYDYAVTVDLQQSVDPANLAQMEALNLIAQQMHDWFRVPHSLTGTNYAVMKADRTEIFVPEMLWSQSVFETYLELTIRNFR